MLGGHRKIPVINNWGPAPGNLAFITAPTARAHNLTELLHSNSFYRVTDPKEADVLVVLGGDGFMLHSLHTYQNLNKFVYGINCGTVGFLMNQPPATPQQLISCLQEAIVTPLHPLKMRAYTAQGISCAYAINEVSLIRQTSQTAKIRITVDGITKLENLVGDGLIIATPAGSTAYNFSANGPILPLNSELIALTPLSAFRPRYWRGALLQRTSRIRLDVLDPKNRPVNVTADSHTVSGVEKLEVHQDLQTTYNLLFDPGYNLEDRIFREQFVNQ